MLGVQSAVAPKAAAPVSNLRRGKDSLSVGIASIGKEISFSDTALFLFLFVRFQGRLRNVTLLFIKPDMASSNES
jgi:hypothetical protein